MVRLNTATVMTFPDYCGVKLRRAMARDGLDLVNRAARSVSLAGQNIGGV